MKVFITGIAGFIGFHLAKTLHARGIEVIGCDNFNDYYSPALKKMRAKELEKLGVRIFIRDILEIKSLELKKEKLTHFIHLAAQVGVRYSLENPQAYASTNLMGFVEVLELCRNLMPIKFIFASSSSVYGLNQKVPFSEDDVVDRPASLYAATKKADEMLAHSYHHLYQIPTVGLRFFTVYGPFGRPDMAYFLFAKAINEGNTLSVFNHGKMKRDFTYIDDIISGIIASLDLNMSYEIFNLGNNKAEELMDMISFLEEGLGKKANIEFLPMQKGDVKATLADIAKSQKFLNYAPKTSLQEGIYFFTSWFKQHFS